MADNIRIDVKGIPELDNLFAQLAGPIVERAMVQGVTEGAKIFQQAVTDAAPIRAALPSSTALPPGELKGHIQIRLTKLRNGMIAAFIEPSKQNRHVARFVEYGHRLVRGGRLKNGRNGTGKIVGAVVAHPFVRPAYESSSGEAIDTVERRILSELTEEAEDLG